MDERRLQHVGLGGDAQIGEPIEQLLEHHADLAPGQVGAEAEVGAAGADAHAQRMADLLCGQRTNRQRNRPPLEHET